MMQERTVIEEESFLTVEEMIEALEDMLESSFETVHLLGNMYSIRRKESE